MGHTQLKIRPQEIADFIVRLNIILYVCCKKLLGNDLAYFGLAYPQHNYQKHCNSVNVGEHFIFVIF
jgi:hypothetical protein